MNNLRPVWIYSDHYAWRQIPLLPQRGLFHCWAGTSECAYALIEIENGYVYVVNQEDFKFLDQVMEHALFKNAWDEVAEGKE